MTTPTVTRCQQCRVHISHGLLCAVCADWLRLRCEVCEDGTATGERDGIRCCDDCGAGWDEMQEEEGGA